MVEVKFVLIDDNDNEQLLNKKIFLDSISKYDKNVSDYVYETVLELDKKYDFIDYDNCPYIEIRYFENDKLKYTDDCVDYMYNL